ncbi:phage tail protein [Microvirgula sp. AG722]|uniref:phage tail protein n=1 Tax=Microvirgula sp. AG722 TaxID=2183901 RepID=UPI001314B00E|nr:phage tail protein [Microvirgula sp. AG722]
MGIVEHPQLSTSHVLDFRRQLSGDLPESDLAGLLVDEAVDRHAWNITRGVIPSMLAQDGTARPPRRAKSLKSCPWLASPPGLHTAATEHLVRNQELTMQDRMPSIDSPDGLFHDGNPFTGEMGTIVTSAHLNDVQSGIQDLQTEAITLLAAAGMQPEPARKNQWLQALKALFLGRDDKARDSAALDGHPAAYFARASDQAAGLPLLFPLWCPNRAAIPAGYAPADGQTLARSLYPDAWAGIAAGNVPVATDAAWLATPTERGKFTAGDGAGTFRLPDYNGKSAGSLGALFMRGDGALSAGADGMIQGDAIRNIVGEYCDDIFRRSSRATGPFVEGTQATTTGAGGSTGASYSLKFDASRQVPTAPENRPLNVTGCWVIRLFGAVVNPGAADAAQLATEVSKLGADKVPWTAFQGSLVTNGYRRLPGGDIEQWGSVSVPGGTQVTVTFPIAFPSALFNVQVTRDGLAGNAPTVNPPFDTTRCAIFNGSTTTQILYWRAIGK